MRVWILLSLSLVAISRIANAEVSDWTATSTTAMAITGDISVEDGRLLFQNGEALDIAPLGPDRDGIYRVDPPRDPVLLNGNRLCGDNPPTFVVLARGDGSDSLADSNSLHLKVFNGTQAPALSATKGMSRGGPGFCALLNYERAGSS